MTNTFKSIRTTYPKLSLKAICEASGLCYQYVLKASKKPIAGQAYDPNDVNYEAIDVIVERKGVNLDDIDWEALASQVRVITPINKVDDFTIGTEFKLRENHDIEEERIYSVIFTTDTHIVFMLINDTQPRVMNWDTFIHQSPRILNKEEKA